MSKLRYLFNLPGNAAKYLHEGVIGLLTQDGQEDDVDWIRLLYINGVLNWLRKISSRPGCLCSGNSLGHDSSRSAAASLVVIP